MTVSLLPKLRRPWARSVPMRKRRCQYFLTCSKAESLFFASPLPRPCARSIVRLPAGPASVDLGIDLRELYLRPELSCSVIQEEPQLLDRSSAAGPSEVQPTLCWPSHPPQSP